MVDFLPPPWSCRRMIAMIPFPNVSAELFSVTLFGMTFALRWYALAYIAGILISWRIGLRAVRAPHLWAHNSPAMRPEQIEDLMTYVVLGVILGGRLGYVIFYQPAYYLANPAETLALWQGGMSFHGGLLGVIAAGWLFTARNGLSKLGTADIMALGVTPGLFLGRLANFFNAELWGRQTDVPWGVVFPGKAAQYCPAVVGACARHPSQLYEGILEGIVLSIILFYMAWRRGALHAPGRIAGVFFAGYGLARFCVEFVRQPDAQFISEGNPLGLAWHMSGMGLTMGQILSLPMIFLGLYLIAQARRAA